MSKMKLKDIAVEKNERVDNPSESPYSIFVGLEHYDSGEAIIRRHGSTEMLESTMKVFHAGDILVARRNVYLRRAASVDFDGLTSGDSIVLHIENEAYRQIIPFVLNTDDFWNYANQHADGSMSKRLSPKLLMEYEFSVPDEKLEQITEILWAMERTKNAYRELIAKTDELVKSQKEITTIIIVLVYIVLKNIFYLKIFIIFRKRNKFSFYDNKRLNQFEERLNLLETKVDQLSSFVHDNIKHNSPKSSIQDKYSFNEDDLVNIGEFSSLKKGQNDSGKKLSNNINNKKKTEDKRFSKFNFELFITNPNESKPSKNINTKKIKRYDSSLFINTNRGEDKKGIKPDNKLLFIIVKLEKKKDPFYTLFTDKTKRLKKYYSKGSFSKKKK